MAVAKKRSKKPAARKRAPKKVTRRPIGRCADVGNELKTLGTSAAAVKARAHGGVCLRKQSKSWRPVKTKTFIVPPRAAARRARLARAAKRRSAEKNGAMSRGMLPVRVVVWTPGGAQQVGGSKRIGMADSVPHAKALARDKGFTVNRLRDAYRAFDPSEYDVFVVSDAKARAAVRRTRR